MNKITHIKQHNNDNHNDDTYIQQLFEWKRLRGSKSIKRMRKAKTSDAAKYSEQETNNEKSAQFS